MPLCKNVEFCIFCQKKDNSTYVSCGILLGVESNVCLLHSLRSSASVCASLVLIFAFTRNSDILSNHRFFGCQRGRFQPVFVGPKSKIIFAGKCTGIRNRCANHHKVRSAAWIEHEDCLVSCSSFSFLMKSNHLRPSILLRLFVWIH